MDSSQPKSRSARSPDTSPAHGLDDSARTLYDPKPGDDEAIAKLSVTQVVDPPTHADHFLSPASTPIISRTDPARPAVGAVLGDYEILEKLGEGAMGAVYRARQISFNRTVALKILFSHIASHPRLVKRLYREGEALAKLDHEGIVQAFGMGEVAGSHFVAMEFVEGMNLQRWLRKLGKVPVGDACFITLAVARALDHAHAQGIIHRDIKPENILISPEGRIKVADLGMVKNDEDDMALTQTGHAIGTPWYMPLEQAKNAKETDARSDIYSLGCMLYCLLTGHPPFQGRTLVELIQSKERGTFPPARSQNSDVTERLDLVILKMTAKQPKDRYASCADLIRDLEKLGVAAPQLSFIGQPGDEGRHATPRPQGTKTLVGLADIDPNVWYVKIPSSPGKHVVKKLSTEQVRALLDHDKIAPTTQVSHHANQGFRALSAHREFGAALSKVTREAADVTTSKYRELYKKIEENEESREDVSGERQALHDSHTRYYLEMAWAYGKYPLFAFIVLSILTWLVRSIL